MSRNMKEANRKFFDNLCNSLDEDISQRVSEATRYIATSDDDKKWLKKVEIKYSVRITKNTYALLLYLGEEDYLCLINVTPSDVALPPELREIQVSPGLATFLGSEGYLTPRKNRADQMEILDKILYDTNDIEYDGHRWSDIDRFFPFVYCYELDSSGEDVEIRENMNLYYRILCKLALAFRLENNPISEISRPIWEKIAYEEELSRITYRNLLLSYTALTWDISYLYLYQCLEDMFACATVRKLHERLGLDISEKELNKALYEELSWQPRDLVGIETLIKGVSSSSQGIMLIQEIANGQSIGRYLYSLRNDIVHETRSPHIPLDDNERWEKTIAGLLYLLKEI